MTLSLSRILNTLEECYPAYYAEKWDNVGLQVGSRDQAIDGVVIALDPSPEAFSFCARQGAQLLLTHHPLFFQPLHSLSQPVLHDILSTAYCNQIALACLHTNVDKAPKGLNWFLSQKLGLINTRILVPEQDFDETWKAILSVPSRCADEFEQFTTAYLKKTENLTRKSCSAEDLPVNDFSPPHDAVLYLFSGPRAPLISFLQEISFREQPVKIESFDSFYCGPPKSYGIGVRGELPEPESFDTVLPKIKEAFSLTDDIRIICPRKSPSKIKNVAICSGSGGRLISSLNRNIDLYISGDINYHQALEAREQGIYVLDASHYGTEIFFLPLLENLFNEHFPSLDVSCYKGDYPWKKI